jgi:hypothetical protein
MTMKRLVSIRVMPFWSTGVLTAHGEDNRAEIVVADTVEHPGQRAPNVRGSDPLD